MIFKENLTEILDGIRPFLLPLNSYTQSFLFFSYLIKWCIISIPQHENRKVIGKSKSG